MNEIEELRQKVKILEQYVESLRWFEYVVMNFHTLTDDQIEAMRQNALEQNQAKTLN